MLKLLVSIVLSVLMVSQCLFALASSGDTETWNTMLDGIKRYSADNKLREEFSDLCREKETAIVNGKTETGAGLYMIIDVPVYRTPGKSKRTELLHEAVVVLTGQSQLFQGVTWKEIEFLFISEYTQKAVSIDTAWIQESHLKK
jgi:hypothetical protein